MMCSGKVQSDKELFFLTYYQDKNENLEINSRVNKFKAYIYSF